MTKSAIRTEERGKGFVEGLGFLDSTLLVAGTMIGSGIFIVSADIARQVGAGGWILLVWLVTGVLTVLGALCYGELAAMMPKAGGQYVYLKEAYSPLWGFLYGWTLFLVIQTGSIAAVAVAFARFLGTVVPAVSPTAWIIPPINLSSNYAISLSSQQLVALLLIVGLTLVNTRGLDYGKFIQNLFTIVKVFSLVALIFLGLFVGMNARALSANFSDFWTPRGVETIRPDLGFLPAVSATTGALGLFVAFSTAQVGSLFASDAWNNVTFTSAEVRNPSRNVPLSMVAGTVLVTILYLLTNVAYLVTLPISGDEAALAADPSTADPLVRGIQRAADDRVGTAALQVIFGGAGATVMAVAIMISTFGCSNGMILAGARVYFAMARDKLFFRSVGRLNSKQVPALGLISQGVWASLLVLPRTRLKDEGGTYLTDPVTGMELYGNLYSNLLDYVVSSVLIFYVLSVVGIFVLRHRRPDAERPYRVFGYPFLPAIYIAAATTITIVLLLYKTQTTWPGLLIVLSGVPVYFLWKRLGSRG